MKKKPIAIVISLAVVASACGDATSNTEKSPEFEESASSCFEQDSVAVSSNTRYEVDPTLAPASEVISAAYESVDYSLEPTANALFDQDLTNPDFPEPVIDIEQIVSGGVAPDGIPSIDEPEFASIEETDFLEDCNEAVVSVEVNGDARAFPIRILISHEIVNTEIGGVPVSVTYCPLCNSALAFDRRNGSRILDFGVSGSLYNSALLMYDRQTGSLWSHFTGESVVGHFAGTKLSLIPAQTVSYGQFVQGNPSGTVLTQENEHSRSGSYGRNPYEKEDTTDGVSGFLFEGEIDDRLERKERVVGVSLGGKAIAVPFNVLLDRSVVSLKENDEELVIFFADGLASPVDASTVADGRDVGQTGVFIPEVNGEKLTFTAIENGDSPNALFIDEQTGSEWNIFGEATSGSLAGESLQPLAHLDAFWFAWAAYRPDTIIIEK